MSLVPGLGSTLGRVLLQHQSEVYVLHRVALGGFLLPQWGSSAIVPGSSNSCCCSRSVSSSTTTARSSSSASSTTTSSKKGTPAASSQPSSSTTSASSTGADPKTHQAAQQRAWQQELRAVRAHVFEHHTDNRQRNGRKAILKPLKGRYIADWYFTLTGPKMPMMVDDVEEE